MAILIAVWNMQGGGNLFGCQALVAKKPDIICLQESGRAFENRKTASWGSSARMSTYSEYKVRNLPFGVKRKSSRCNMTTLTKAGLTSQRERLIAAKARRRAVEGVLVGDIRVYNIHAPASGDAAAFRYILDVVYAAIGKGGNWSIAGDMNCRKTYLVSRLAKYGLDWLNVIGAHSATHQGGGCIDYIISNVSARHVGSIGGAMSDHMGQLFSVG